MTTDKERADKERHDKERHDKERHDNLNPNPAPDPNAPRANRAEGAEPPAGGSKGATGQPAVALPPEAYMTEQEKDALKGGVPSSKQPYPTGDPPPVHETTTRSQGIKGATDPKETPVDSSGPAGTTKKETK